jgi:predicted site-specific integrase-resolvase
MKKHIKLSQYAKNYGITYRTAQNWFYSGKIEGAKKNAVWGNSY